MVEVDFPCCYVYCGETCFTGILQQIYYDNISNKSMLPGGPDFQRFPDLSPGQIPIFSGSQTCPAGHPMSRIFMVQILFNFF